MTPAFDPKRLTGPVRVKFKLTAPGRFQELKQEKLGNGQSAVTVENIDGDEVTLTLHNPDSLDIRGLEFLELVR